MAHFACMARERCSDVAWLDHMLVQPKGTSKETSSGGYGALALSLPPRSLNCACGGAAHHPPTLLQRLVPHEVEGSDTIRARGAGARCSTVAPTWANRGPRDRCAAHSAPKHDVNSAIQSAVQIIKWFFRLETRITLSLVDAGIFDTVWDPVLTTLTCEKVLGAMKVNAWI